MYDVLRQWHLDKVCVLSACGYPELLASRPVHHPIKLHRLYLVMFSNPLSNLSLALLLRFAATYRHFYRGKISVYRLLFCGLTLSYPG